RLPTNRPTTQSSCHARRSNGPSWMNGKSLKVFSNMSLTCACAMNHVERLTEKTVPHPQRRAAQNTAGVRKENRMYIGRMSINGGRNSSASDPPIAAQGFIREWFNKFLIPGNPDKKKPPR